MTTAMKPHDVVMNKYEWRLHAKCKDAATRYHDPYELTGDVINKQAKARELCSGCPVVQQCAKAALAAPSVGLVRAGQWIPLEAGSHTGYSPLWVDVLTMIAEGEA